MDSDAASVNRMLLDRFEEVVSMLLPSGKKEKNLWMVGSIAGEPGHSLQITLSGSAAGRFKDFAHDEVKGASPLWLWCQVKNIKFPEAIKEAKEWLGVSDKNFGVRRMHEKEWRKPEKAPIRLAEPNTKVMDYLTLERRLNPIVIAAARVCETEDGEAIVFPFYEHDDEAKKDVLVHRKFLKLERPEGKKESWTTKGTKRCLFAKQLIGANISEITITEGEIDALSFLSQEIPAVSIPNGVSDYEWVDLDWEWLDRFERINVCMDMDDVGRQAAQEVCRRLGLHRCYIVSLPFKDVNECLQKDIKRDAMLKLLADAKPIELDEIKKPNDFTDEVLDYYKVDPALRGWETPWLPVLPWRVRKSEFTILTGFGGHGKALALDTKIPTPTGWKTMGELFPGDKVFDQLGNPCNVTFATPVQLNRKCYEVLFSDGSRIVADAEHLWETWSPNVRASWSRLLRRKRDKKSSSYNCQIDKAIKPTVSNTETILGSLRHKNGHLNHAIPVALPIKTPLNTGLEIYPYCLGAWLGDGDSEGYGFTCGKGDEEILDVFAKNGFNVVPHKIIGDRCPHYGISGLRKHLSALGLVHNKRIPDKYLWAHEAQRMSLLQGLMDTDGCITEYGRCEFTSMGEGLARDVLQLVCSLGMRPTLTTGEASVNGKKCGTKYRVFFTPSYPVFRLKRKADRLNYGNQSRRNYRYIVAVNEIDSVPVKCIQVDSERHLYLCGETMIPTHNTAGLNQLMLHLVNQGLRVMDASLEIKPGMTLYNMTRCALGKKYSDRDDVEACINWINDSMFFLDCIGTVNVKRLMTAMEYARKRHGIDVFVIDSLFKCGLSSEDYGAQREFADVLTTFCNNTGAHVILVAHSRKTQNGNETQIPSKSDVAGSSDLTNAAFNVIVFWRNKRKKRMLDEAREKNDTETISKWIDEPDGKIVIDKQRFGEGEEREISVWFDHGSCQFHPQKYKVLPYFEFKKA